MTRATGVWKERETCREPSAPLLGLPRALTAAWLYALLALDRTGVYLPGRSTPLPYALSLKPPGTLLWLRKRVLDLILGSGLWCFGGDFREAGLL